MTEPGITQVVVCPSCGAPLQPDDVYCEACGAGVGVDAADPGTGQVDGVRSSGAASEPTASNTRSCAHCGAPPAAIDPDGFCEHCGMRQPRPRDHQEIDIGGAAGVTDRGLHHHRNEDALYLKATDDQSVVVVVCDGVSSSVDPDVASQTAVDVAGAMLLDAVASPPDELAHAISEAVGAAQDAILAIPWTPQADLGGPSCTLVSAVIHDGTITVAWVGDSRAYWVGPDGARQLTEDDSWAAAQVAAGIMTAEEASANPQAHAITRWLGEDAPPEGPHLRTFHPETPGRLLVCSDGLWNYAPAPEDLDRLMGGAPPDATTLRVAQALTKFALSAGGHDNITVAVVDVGVRSTKGAE